ncbi:MAG: FMN-red domain-containing protein [Mitsuokella multacida]
MSKILLVNGSPHEKGCTYTALHEMAETFAKLGVETELLWLGKKPLQDCIACNKCMELGHCIFDDIVNETAAKLKDCAGIVVGSPVYYAGPTGMVTSFLDRLTFSCTKDSRLHGKLAASIVSCRRGGATAAFDRLNKYFQMSNMAVVGSQYWNQVHGFTPDDVRQDLEGLQTMRTLARNMAWLAKCIEAGKKAGIE